MGSVLPLSVHIGFPTKYILRCTMRHHCPLDNQHRLGRYDLHNLQVLEESLQEPVLLPMMGSVKGPMMGWATGPITGQKWEQRLEKVTAMQ